MTNAEEFSIATLKSLWKDGATGFLVTSPTTFPTYEEAEKLLERFPIKEGKFIVSRFKGKPWGKA